MFVRFRFIIAMICIIYIGVPVLMSGSLSIMHMRNKMDYNATLPGSLFGSGNYSEISEKAESKPRTYFKTYTNKSFEEIVQLQKQLADKRFKHFVKYNLFSFVWWLQVILLISLWFIWWQHVDKSRLLEIVAYGLIVAIIAIVIDIVGVEYVWWTYPQKFLPISTAIVVVNFSIIPIIYMVVYQSFSRWKEFCIASIIMGFVYTFIFESIGKVLYLYELISWRSIYDLPLYILLAIFAKALICIIMRKQKNTKLLDKKE